jgi:hypothetical protein
MHYISKYIASEYYWRIVMSKEKKGNKESKSPKRNLMGLRNKRKTPKDMTGI